LKSRQSHLVVTLTRGIILPRGIDNATCHTKDMTRDVKKIRTHGYPLIKPATGRERILKMDTHYLRVRVFLIPAC